MKVKKTYSRKKTGKPAGNSSTNVNINLFCNFINIINITNNSSTHEKTESSKSESSDLFDKLVKGPIYHVNNQSKLTFGSSNCSRKFFSQRQDSATFYKSNAELSISTDISNNLFKDSKDSEIYTPTWPSPPEYCKIKNKLVKIKKEQKITISQCKIKQISQNKAYNRIQKKRPVTRPNKVLTHVNPVCCTSSTPNRSDASLNKYTWPDKHVSPIMPLQYSPKMIISPEHMLETGQNERVRNQNAMLGVTALIEGLGNLGIETPHRKKVVDVVKSANKEAELFDYKSPLEVSVYRQREEKDSVDKVNSAYQEPDLFDYKSPSSVSVNHQSDESNGDASQQSVTDMPCKKSDEENNGVLNLLQVDEMNSSKMLTNNNSCKTGEEIYSGSGVSTPEQKRFQEEGNFEELDSGQLPCKSLSLELINVNSHDVSGYSAITSPCTKALRDPEHSIINHYKNQTPSKLLSSIPEKEICNEWSEETDSRNSSLSSCKEINSHSSSDTKLKSGNVEPENSEKYSDNSDYNCSLLDLEDKNNKYYSEEINECNNLINIKGGDKKSEMYKDPEVSCLNDSNHQESPVKELKIKIKSSETESQIYKKEQKVSGLIESNCKTSPDKELKACKPQPLSDLTNLALVDTSENAGEICKRSIPFGKENKRAAQYGIRDKFSVQPSALATDLNETLVKVNLEAGKKWRRSLLRQKQPETKFDRRASMSADTLVRLIRESSILSGLTNDTKISYNNTTRIIDSLLEQEAEKSSLPVPGGSPGFNLTFSKLSRIHTRRKRIYISDMNEIPEEMSDHSTGKYNETVFYEEESALQQDQGNAVECESVCDTTVNQTDAYETPPILKMNPEALSAITDRKRSRRYLARSLGECSMFSDVGEQNEMSDEENKFFTSCCSKLELEDDLEDFNDQNIELMGKVGFLLRCGQQEPIPFSEAFPEQVLSRGQKIGEGVFGEVFMLERPGEGRSVIKIIPVEGSQMVNGALQKHFDEVLSELIITEELSMLRQNYLNCTTGFCELKSKYYLQGQYPSQLLSLWHEFDSKKGSDNQCPDMFGPDQLFLALELAHAGEAVESYRFRSPQQALAVFLQTTFSLAVAESAAEFEHRDLHIGNVLVQTTSEKYITFVLNGTRFECPTNGTMATIIDYTLSRIAFKDDVLYLDLEKDPELFSAEGDYQFDIYRHMRADLRHNWRDHQPKTNVRWLHYLMDKLCDRIKYKQKKSTKVYKEYMEKLVRLKGIILDFYSATDLAQHLFESYSQTVKLIRR